VSASAHSGNHDQAFYEAAIENTVELTATTGSLSATPDAGGALPPGRYLIQSVGLAAGQVVWVHVGPFERGVPLAPSSPVAAGERRFPLTETIVALEAHLLGGYSDRVAVQLSSGSNVTVYISRVSTEVMKSNKRA